MDSQIKLSNLDNTIAAIKGVPNKEQLLEMLSNNIYVVKFKKLNGDIRELNCTMLEEFLPEVKNKKKSDKNLITVWDIDQNSWKSFHYKRIIEIKKNPDKIMEARLRMIETKK